MKLDLEYIDNWSLWLDLKILFIPAMGEMRPDPEIDDGGVGGESLKNRRKARAPNKEMEP